MLTELSFLSAEPQSKEQRRQKRWQLVNYLRVFDAADGKLLGHLVDVNQDGIMILSTEALTCGREYRLKMERLANGEFSHINLTVITQWSKPDQDPYLHNTGCELVSPSAEAIDSLQILMDELRQGQNEINV